MSVVLTPKARTTTRTVKMVAEVTSNGIDEHGFVDRRGLSRIKRGVGKVEVYFEDRVLRGATYYKRRLFLAPFLSVISRVSIDGARVRGE